MYVKWPLLLIVAGALLYDVDAANILGIFHVPSQSHHILGSALLKSLAKRGHQVTMISPFPLKNPVPNYKDIAIINLMQKKNDQMVKMLKPDVSTFEKIRITYTLLANYGDYAFSQASVKQLLASNATFDVVIQYWGYSEAMTVVSHHFKAPVVGLCVVGLASQLTSVSGLTLPSSYVPNVFSDYTDKMTFWQRLTNTALSIYVDLNNYFINMPMQQVIVQKYFPNAPPLEEIMENVDLMLANTNFLSDTPRPYLPNTIPIGGFHLEEEVEKLPEDIKQFLDEAKEGVIYLNLGSNVNWIRLPTKFRDAFIKSFSKLKLKVLWKYEDKELPGKPHNVMIGKWLPQRAILAHPNVKLFHTHCGLGGLQEAIYNAVPMISTPFFGDQSKNSAGMVKDGHGIELLFQDINENTITAAIKEVLENPKYRQSVQRLSSMYRDQPMSPMETAVYWVEHVIKHKGAKHLKALGAQLPFYQYMLLDVFAAIFGIFFIPLFIVYYLVKKIISTFKKRKPAKKIKNK